jgi:chaperone modulatory protein CbpM
MPDRKQSAISCAVVTKKPEFTLEDLCQVSGLDVEKITAYVEEGVVVPQGLKIEHWRFSRLHLIEVRRASRLENDLGLNPAGIALALDLAAQIKNLKMRLKHLEQDNL